MKSKDEILKYHDGGFDPSIQTEKIAFDPDELVRCVSCGRNNAPTRVTCLYCGTITNIDPEIAETVKGGFRKPELWESGRNLIFDPSSDNSAVQTARAAAALSMDASQLEKILASTVALPLARVGSESEARSLAAVLARFGLQASVISDDALLAEKPPTRLAGIAFEKDHLSLLLFNSRTQTTLPVHDLALLVGGTVSVSKIDQVVRRGRGGSARVLDDVATITDETILDIYGRADQMGFRIHTSGFDFSCIGAAKTLIAADNLVTLAERLSSISPHAKTVTEYRSVREVLGIVWEIESRRDAQGMRFSGVGKRGFGSVDTTSNLNQFTRFSRLQRMFV